MSHYISDHHEKWKYPSNTCEQRSTVTLNPSVVVFLLLKKRQESHLLSTTQDFLFTVVVA